MIKDQGEEAGALGASASQTAMSSSSTIEPASAVSPLRASSACAEIDPSGLEWAQLGFAKQILVDVLGVDIADRCTPDALLVEDLGADSLDMVEIQCVLTDHGLSAPDEAFSCHMRVRDLAALIIEPVA